ncbi:MAG: hydrogenase nickel incorporation protein HypB [Planctomycetes bacterium]|jgi:hydrogenase nickel incorporation protein HypB|nr:hydrogenase nickel incorporation protein HypB [Planctomycetota bacterium]MBT4028165.1 hydrogenase nickel incorporation protein HypB [Planctomycetota bacterium]MBT4560710.1 hydrogenase nickel incorporation protein HypB [Planctomycetota bacterium]MBT5101928.1 hydrogenase nickel incorporation protein HypB [Planctomycetota bacterium]MBT7011278.1 hydrogenase nickel incorporation protein HypB [Planctomycetota bacterium]
MCKDCGCETANAVAVHGHRHLDLETRVLAVNDEAAAKNRAWLTERGIKTLNIISSPGSGKTQLLERTLERLAQRGVKVAVIVGDQQTDNDAQRLQGKGAPVIQIETGASCHLNAQQIGNLLPEIIEEDTELLLIENIGNLVCPAAFDLGETAKVALLSVCEGEDKPVKYPLLFHDAAMVLLTKIDLIPHLDWDAEKCHQALHQVAHHGKHLSVSARSGEGMKAWIDWLIGK